MDSTHILPPSSSIIFLTSSSVYKLTKNAAKDKFKVILDGTGLDEAFGGYEKHHLMYLNNLKRKKSNQFFK